MIVGVEIVVVVVVVEEEDDLPEEEEEDMDVSIAAAISNFMVLSNFWVFWWSNLYLQLLWTIC